jgi:hypothetical protein
MDALFIIVAQLLLIPLVLWALIALELTLGVAASVVAVVAGRRSATEALTHSWRAIRRKLLWSLIFVSSGLLLADLVFFQEIVTLALGSVDDREDLDVRFSHAEGSFMLGRIELHGLTIAGIRGQAGDPNAQFAVAVEQLVIDIDMRQLLTATFAVEELTVQGVRGEFDRLRAGPKRDLGDRPAREFSVTHLHLGDLKLTLRDHTRAELREVEVVIDELDLGPLASESAAFDLLYRSRGRGSVAGHRFVLTSSTSPEGEPQSTFELSNLSLDAFAERIERAAGIRAQGTAGLTVVSRYREGPPEPQVTLGIDLRLHGLELEAGADASRTTRMLLRVAERELAKLGDEFPLAFEITILRSELAGARSLVESGVIERVVDATATALRDRLSTPRTPARAPD